MCLHDQCALAVFAQPPVNDVGVDGMFECDGGNGCARFSALPNNLEFELGTVKPPLGTLVRASLAMVCMIFIVHTISGNQPLLKMTWPDVYAPASTWLQSNENTNGPKLCDLPAD